MTQSLALGQKPRGLLTESNPESSHEKVCENVFPFAGPPTVNMNVWESRGKWSDETFHLKRVGSTHNCWLQDRRSEKDLPSDLRKSLYRLVAERN